MANHNETISFPYANFAQAQADGFKRVGGADEFFRHATNGWKQGIWRKKANEKQQDEVKRAKAFYKEHLAKTGGDKADRQLGRK